MHLPPGGFQVLDGLVFVTAEGFHARVAQYKGVFSRNVWYGLLGCVYVVLLWLMGREKHKEGIVSE